jgi:hypothetical protein
MKVKSIILGVFVIILLYVLYRFLFKSNGTSLSKFANAEQSSVVSANGLSGGGSSQYSFSVWFYINQWNDKYGEKKIIYERRSSDNSVSPSVFLGEYDNNVHAEISYYNPSSSNPTNQVFDCTVPNVPIQRWNNLIFVCSTRTLDIYLQGKLVKTCVLPGVAKVDSGANVTLTPGGGFSGYTSSFKFFDSALNPQQAYNVYKEGYGGSSLLGNLFNKFRLRISFMNNERTVNSFEI